MTIRTSSLISILKASSQKARILASGILAFVLLGTTIYFVAPTAYAAVTTILGVGSLAHSETLDGPATVTVRTISFAPGEVGQWHYHPGPLYNVVTQGTVTLEDGYCGPDRSFGPGQAFEEGGRIHRPKNGGEEPTFAYQTFVIPAGMPTTINVPNFKPRCGNPPPGE